MTNLQHLGQPVHLHRSEGHLVAKNYLSPVYLIFDSYCTMWEGNSSLQSGQGFQLFQRSLSLSIQWSCKTSSLHACCITGKKKTLKTTEYTRVKDFVKKVSDTATVRKDLGLCRMSDASHPRPLSALLHSHQRFCDSLKKIVHACCPSTRAARSNIMMQIQFNANVEVKQSKL